MSTVVVEPPPDLFDITEIANHVRTVAKTLVTEDDEPVDNLYCAKLQRLLVQVLYASWLPLRRRASPDFTFLADSNVAIYPTLRSNPLVPDVFLSVGVEVGDDWRATKEPRCYFLWEFGKAPDVVVEIVSNKVGHELDGKLRAYARVGVRYYVVYDAWLNLGEIPVQVYELTGGDYRLRPDLELPDVGLGLILWEGEYEGLYGDWLRWTDAAGNLLPTGQERAERLGAKLRELGIDPDKI